jgi:hypothetical protein
VADSDCRSKEGTARSKPDITISLYIRWFSARTSAVYAVGGAYASDRPLGTTIPREKWEALSAMTESATTRGTICTRRFTGIVTRALH